MTYQKVELVLDAPQQRSVATELRFAPVRNADDERALLEAMAEVVASDHFVFERAWWHIAYASDGSTIGFTQPVVFRGCARGALEEGTLHYIGVVPGARERGHGHTLLQHATLCAIGVWRVYCDTDVMNVPMIRAFERAGYQRGRTRDVAFHD